MSYWITILNTEMPCCFASITVNPFARPDENVHTWWCSKYFTLLNYTRLNYLAGKNQVNSATTYSMSYPSSLFIYSYTAVSYPSLLSQPVSSNTLLLIPNEFGTVFELGVQILKWLEELEMQNSQALEKPEREKNSHNRFIRSTYVQSDSHRILFPVSISLQSAVEKQNSTTRSFHGLVFLIVTRLALTSVLGPFAVYFCWNSFYTDTPVHWCTIRG